MDGYSINPANTSVISADVVNVLVNSGLADPGNPVLTLISGGGDSVALLAALVELRSSDGVFALHVNYGLRDDESAGDEDFCRQLCARFGVDLSVVKAPEGFAEGANLQARAREFRYALAEERAAELGGARIAVAHTADDQAETVLYRLFSSPGRDALHGMSPERGDIVRPFLGLRRAQLRAWLTERGIEWREDSSNADPRFARVRTRELLSAAEDLHPAAVENLLRSTEQLREESAELAAVVDGLIEDCRDEHGGLSAAGLANLPPALAGRVLRTYLEGATGKSLPAAQRALPGVLELAASGGTNELQIEGVSIHLEYGSINVAGAAVEPEIPRAVSLPITGRTQFGDWRIEASGVPLNKGAVAERGSDDSPETPENRMGKPLSAIVTLAGEDAELTVRGRRAGDRIELRGLGGSKSLQDLYVDRKLPRRLRDAHPVVCEGDRVVWIPGLAQAADPRGGSTRSVSVVATRLH